jgi:hypothetical protein
MPSHILLDSHIAKHSDSSVIIDFPRGWGLWKLENISNVETAIIISNNPCPEYLLDLVVLSEILPKKPLE